MYILLCDEVLIFDYLKDYFEEKILFNIGLYLIKFLYKYFCVLF